MRKLFILLIVALAFTFNASANVFRVNNTLTTNKAQKIFSNIQAANDSAYVVSGDTLMIEGSPTEYLTSTITKRLVIIGPGYFLTENPQTQAYPGQAVVRQMTFKNGSSGSVLIGLTFASYYDSYAPFIEVNNILISRCYLPHPINTIGNLNNIQITQNYFVTSAILVYYDFYTFTGVSLKNNFITDDLIISSNNQYQRVFSAIDNNIFLGSIAATTTTFRSNIILNTAATATIASASIQNNLVSATQLPLTNGNQTYTAGSLFVGATGNSTDGQYKLKAYLTAGYNGTQPGIFGGSQPYVLSGIPPIPSIYEFTADGFVNKNTGLPIYIKVKANQ